MATINYYYLKEKTMHFVTGLISLLLMNVSIYAQDTVKKVHLPIIDIHVHAMKVNPAFAMDMCPGF